METFTSTLMLWLANDKRQTTCPLQVICCRSRRRLEPELSPLEQTHRIEATGWIEARRPDGSPSQSAFAVGIIVAGIERAMQGPDGSKLFPLSSSR